MNLSRKQIHSLSLGLLILCLVVILWGAFVRFSNSGDGCGESWPLCEGALIPTSVNLVAPWIEYVHRLTSGLFGLIVVFMTIVIFKSTQRGDPLRRYGALVAVFTVFEGLVGAGLVLRGLVAQNDSLERAVWLGAHVVNTLILLATLVGVYVHSGSERMYEKVGVQKKYLPYLLLFLVLAITGSIASLSNTLYPSDTLFEGIAADFNPQSPFLIRIRLLHPVLGFLFFICIIDCWQKANKRMPAMTQRLLLLTGGNFLVGAITLVLLSPLQGRLLHILMTDCVWLQLVGLAMIGSVEESEYSVVMKGGHMKGQAI